MRRLPGGRWTSRAVFAVVAVLVLVGFARVEHTSPLLVPMVLIVCAVVAIFGMVVDTAGIGPTDWSVGDAGGAMPAGQDAPLLRDARVIGDHQTSRTLDTALAHRLARLTDDRLGRLGLTRRSPGVADRLGPTLTGLLDDPRRRISLTELDECIRRIEELRA